MWYDWIINYISEPIRKSVSGFKVKIISVSKTSTPKQTIWERTETKQTKKTILKSLLYKKRTNKIKDRIIRDIWILLKTGKEKRRKKTKRT